MRILVCTANTPGLAPNLLIEYLKTQTQHDVQAVVCPAKHERRFIPGVSHIQNIRQVLREATGHYDLAVAPDPAFMQPVARLQARGQVDMSVYWRLDYYPRKYPGPLDRLYHWLESSALASADIIWSMAEPRLPHVKESLRGHQDKTIWVPYLTHSIVRSTQPRLPVAVWIGPDLDGSRPLAARACMEVQREHPELQWRVADYSQDETRLSWEELNALLDVASVGVGPYQPGSVERMSKYYCDSSRLRTFLNHGVPTVTTPVAPNYQTIALWHAGYICDWTIASMAEGIRQCLANVDRWSANAYDAAEGFTFSHWFSHDPVLGDYSLAPSGFEDQFDRP